MAERTTIARPYAQAIFQLAAESGQLGKWSELLALAAAVSEDDLMSRIIASPRLGRKEIADLFLEACGDGFDEAGRNFIKVLADNRRLPLLPEIAVLYEMARREAEGTVEADVVSAMPLSDAQRDEIVAALGRRLGKKVSLHCKTDDSLLGGLVIRAGDLVIDGSVAAKLDRLKTALTH